VCARDRQTRVEVGVERDDDLPALTTPVQDATVVFGGEADVAGVDCVKPGVPEELSRSPRHALVEEELHEAVGSVVVSSPTIAAA
jgi:hypothetical protein